MPIYKYYTAQGCLAQGSTVHGFSIHKKICLRLVKSTYNSIELSIHLQFKTEVYEVLTSKGQKDHTTQTEQPIFYKDDCKSYLTIILEHWF